MANENVLRVLYKKRDELAVATAEAEAALLACRQDLGHIEAAIRLLHEPKPKGIAAGRRPGDLSWPLRNILREATQPLTIHAIVDRYLVIKGKQEPPSKGQRMILIQALRRSLVKLRDRGLITSSPGPDNCHLWRINPSTFSPHSP